MGWLDRFRKKQVTDDTKWLAASRPLGMGDGRPAPPPYSPRTSVNAYRSWAYAAANLNANAVASIPLRLYVRAEAQSAEKLWRTRPVPSRRKAYLMGDAHRQPSASVMKAATMAGDFEEVTDAHPVLTLLQRANADEDGFGLASTRILFLELVGNAYLHVVTDEALGVPSALYTVPAHHVTIVPGMETLIAKYLYGQSSQSMREFSPDEIIHFRRPNPKSLYYGMGRVEAAWGALALNAAHHEQDIAFAENMSRPDYAAIIKGGASEQAMRRFEESMRSLHQGSRKAGRMVAISGDIQLQPLSFPGKDMTGREDVVEEIAAVFGVPVSMMKANDPNLASATAGYAAWREGTIAPICRLDEETLNARLLPLFGIEDDAYLAYDDAVPANRAADSAERTAAVAGGWRTPNEARLEDGFEPLDDPEADKLHVGGQPLGGVPMNPLALPVARAADPVPAAVPEPMPEPKLGPVADAKRARLDALRMKVAEAEAVAFAKAIGGTPDLSRFEAEVEAAKARANAAEKIVLDLEASLADEG